MARETIPSYTPSRENTTSSPSLETSTNVSSHDAARSTPPSPSPSSLASNFINPTPPTLQLNRPRESIQRAHDEPTVVHDDSGVIIRQRQRPVARAPSHQRGGA
eukprot:CAMPEP_0179714462 /NCGR_PEP_ID=MMETSP0938-20121108/851_1 /TAXON_ID=548131 ORGANISM="Ostreococcus mediterraneus, Strain clade-D-RCC1107" /NCGR_SAMPLE_ID=MMETSP0938 /ASSEMBLY_ACC=CAM_ASM_000576 /LENGTH=103 /DNA_ID=CAMNT_0021588125 /DNA_START=431 /DNA_END=739 /DNA_ORIENTATION=-